MSEAVYSCPHCRKEIAVVLTGKGQLMLLKKEDEE